MKPPCKKVIVISAVVVGIAVLVAAGFALKPVILAQWYVWMFESEDEAVRVAAAEKLVEMKSLKAVPLLVDSGTTQRTMTTLWPSSPGCVNPCTQWS